MDVSLVIVYVIIVVLWLAMVMTVVTCCNSDKKDKAPSVEVEDKNVQLAGSIHGTGSAAVPSLPKLPPKGEEVDAPLPTGYAGGSLAQSSSGFAPGKKRGKRSKIIPKAGHTCPVKPADEDPTMPVEDDVMAMKMAAANRPATPPPKFPR